MSHDLKIMSLLVFKPSCDRKATFLSFLLTISVRKALENRKMSWKQLITRPISNLWGNRPSCLFAHIMYVWTVYQHISCTLAVSPSKLGGTGGRRWLCLKRTLHKSIPGSLHNLFFPPPFPCVCSSIDYPDKIDPHANITVPSFWLGEMQTFYFATGQSEFGLPGFAWKQAQRNRDFFLPLYCVMS